MTSKKNGFYQSFMKRPMDFVLALSALVFLSPVLIILSILVNLKLGKPVLFKQKRPGMNHEIFTMYKFRTMTDEKDIDGKLLTNNMRHTKFGRFLRSTSLDELPGLINVVKGDMSLVGPRPLLVEYLELYNSNQKRRHEVRPGLSGLAQVKGRNLLTWEEKFDQDITYVDSVSFLNDVKIIILTIKKVFVREGINFENNVINTKFKGSN